MNSFTDRHYNRLCRSQATTANSKLTERDGMAGVSIVGLLMVVFVVVLVAVLLGAGVKGLRRPRFGHVKLNCPHCDAETRADLPTCQHCEEVL